MASPVRQFAMLPVLFLSSKIDFAKPDNLLLLQMCFGTVIIGGYALIQLALYRARKVNDQSRVADPGKMMHLRDEDKAADGSVSAVCYDMAKLNESKMQWMMGAGMGTFVHLNWGWTQPLIVMAITQPLQLLDNKAVLIYLRGHKYERPFPDARANNPLAQWAERKQAEAAATTTNSADAGQQVASKKRD